jgi:hypothetical protein
MMDCSQKFGRNGKSDGMPKSHPVQDDADRISGAGKKTGISAGPTEKTVRFPD